MAVIITAGVPFTVSNPYRDKRPSSQKIIFLSCEGSVTEEEYFAIVTKIFDSIKSRIRFISVVEDEIHTRAKVRTVEQNRVLGQNKPKQLVEKINRFKEEKEDIYQFSKHKEDEFWIVTDIDQNTEAEHIEDFKDALNMCDEKGYGYAISNPFFEMWLLLHHDDVKDDDRAYAVTPNHKYEPTNHFKERMRDLNVPMYGNGGKYIHKEHYNLSKIKMAVTRAKALHIDTSNRYPEYYATTVYKLMEKMLEMLE